MAVHFTLNANKTKQNPQEFLTSNRGLNVLSYYEEYSLKLPVWNHGIIVQQHGIIVQANK